MANLPTRQEQTQAAYDNWNVNRGVDDETLHDLGYATPETLSGTIARTAAVAELATLHESSLEEVNESHVPPEGVKHEAKLREPPRPRTAYQKMLADRRSIPESQRISDRDESRRLSVVKTKQARHR